MFLEFAPAYFEYMAKAFYNNIPTALCKILGVYTVGYHNKDTGKKAMENVVVRRRARALSPYASSFLSSLSLTCS